MVAVYCRVGNARYDSAVEVTKFFFVVAGPNWLNNQRLVSDNLMIATCYEVSSVIPLHPKFLAVRLEYGYPFSRHSSPNN